MEGRWLQKATGRGKPTPQTCVLDNRCGARLGLWGSKETRFSARVSRLLLRSPHPPWMAQLTWIDRWYDLKGPFLPVCWVDAGYTQRIDSESWTASLISASPGPSSAPESLLTELMPSDGPLAPLEELYFSFFQWYPSLLTLFSVRSPEPV